MMSESESSQNTSSFSLIAWLPLTSPWINLDSENCEYLCESRCLKLKEMCTPSCNIFSTLVQLDETPAQAASETNSRLKLDKRRRGQSKNRLTFFFFFLIQAELFLSHFFIQRLTSHYLKPLFLPVWQLGRWHRVQRIGQDSSSRQLRPFNIFHFLFMKFHEVSPFSYYNWHHCGIKIS